MGTIMSPVKEVDHIWWSRKTGRALKAKSVVIIPQEGQHGIMVAALADGSFACSRDLSKYAYMPGSWPWMDATIKALVKLGAITQDAADRHMKVCEETAKRNSDRYAAEALERLAADTGIPLSDEQAAFVSAHSRKAQAA